MTGAKDQYADSFDSTHRAAFLYGIGNLPFWISMSLLPFPFGSLLPARSAFGSLPELLLRRVSPSGRSFSSHNASLRAASDAFIKAKMNDPKLSEQEDMLALFLRAKSPSGEPMAQQKYVPFLTDIVLSMVIAGRDTTACLLSWLLLELCRNPEVQEKLAAEVSAAFADEDPTFDTVTHTKLPYLNGCIYEALRMHPPVPMSVPKYCTKDNVELPNGVDGKPFKLHKRDQIHYVPWVMGRDESVYAEPEFFRPERWIPFKMPNQYEFPVFQAGPRICLGMNMAVFEAKVMAAMLLRKFKFRLAPGEEEKITYSLMVTMSVQNSRPGEPTSHKLLVVPERR